ncbi:MAG: alpha/beta hydrolase [Alphaproteobacteria bacterium]|nr:alpha/beta hydrolase [Alphaproteobacteria bacterium]MBV8549185.1 alpha/beta hydrolase [Alphaproteobacteria bacterium]
MIPDFYTIADRRLAYQRRIGRLDRPGVVFLGGFASDMTGTKAGYLAERCSAADLSFMRFDYRGHGQSSGKFTDHAIGDWIDDARHMLALVAGQGQRQVLVGSSMGGWIALALAQQLPESIAAVVGIAAAPDFTEDLMWQVMTPEQKAIIQRDGLLPDEHATPEHNAPITLRLIEDGRAHLLLRKPLRLSCPTHLLQGMRDADVPWRHALKIADCITRDDVAVSLIKDGDHRLSRPQDLEMLWRAVTAFVATDA